MNWLKVRCFPDADGVKEDKVEATVLEFIELCKKNVLNAKEIMCVIELAEDEVQKQLFLL